MMWFPDAWAAGWLLSAHREGGSRRAVCGSMAVEELGSVGRPGEECHEPVCTQLDDDC
jgi:hypothetical protein